MATAPRIVSDELWELVEPLSPKKSARVPVGAGAVPTGRRWWGILFVLRTGIAWRHLPAELGFGSGVTCWRRRSGRASGELHGLLLE